MQSVVLHQHWLRILHYEYVDRKYSKSVAVYWHILKAVRMRCHIGVNVLKIFYPPFDVVIG